MRDQKTETRLARLIPRLGSDRDAEVLAAVAAIRRTLDRDGRDLHDLADRLTAAPEGGTAAPRPAAPAARGAGADLEAMARTLDLCARDRLTQNQRDFVRRARAMLETGRTLSPAQARWLRKLHETKVEREDAR